MSVIKSNYPLSVKIGDFTIIGENTVIGENTRISSHCNIYGATLGSRCMVGTMVEIQKGALIGDRVRIQSHSFICSSVTIEDDVFISHGVKFCNDTFSDGEVHYSSDDWKRTLIKKNARIGTNVTLLPVTVGENTTVGAGSVVTRSLPDNCVAYGNPATVKYYLKENKDAS